MLSAIGVARGGSCAYPEGLRIGPGEDDGQDQLRQDLDKGCWSRRGQQRWDVDQGDVPSRRGVVCSQHGSGVRTQDKMLLRVELVERQGEALREAAAQSPFLPSLLLRIHHLVSMISSAQYRISSTHLYRGRKGAIQLRALSGRDLAVACHGGTEGL